MTKATIRMQRSFIRLLKGMLTAWDEWLNEQEGIEKKF